MENLGDVIERRICYRRATSGLCAIVIGTFLIGGAWLGAREYMERGGAVAAEQRIRQKLDDNTLERSVFYASWPGRQIGYWLASR